MWHLPCAHAYDKSECTCPSINTGTIVGVVVAVAAVLIIAAIAVATLVILRSCRGKFSLHNNEESVFLDITFSIPHNYILWAACTPIV